MVGRAALSRVIEVRVLAREPDLLATKPQREDDFGFPVVKLGNNRAQMGMALALRPKDNTPRGVQEKLFVGVTDYAATPHVYLSHAIDGPTFRVVAHEILLDLSQDRGQPKRGTPR